MRVRILHPSKLALYLEGNRLDLFLRNATSWFIFRFFSRTVGRIENLTTSTPTNYRIAVQMVKSDFSRDSGFYRNSSFSTLALSVLVGSKIWPNFWHVIRLWRFWKKYLKKSRIPESIGIQDPAPKLIFNTLSVGRIENLTKLLTCNSTMAILKKIF